MPTFFLFHLFLKTFTDWDKLLSYSGNGETVTVQEFHNFLLTEQQDTLGRDDSGISNFMEEYLQSPQKNVGEPCFTILEFINFLYSKQNEIWDRKNEQVTQNMTLPLCHYWIASSHNR